MFKWFKKINETCPRCFGRGTIDRKERIPKEDLTPAQYALTLVEGGYYYRKIHVTCPECNGTGKKA